MKEKRLYLLVIILLLTAILLAACSVPSDRVTPEQHLPTKIPTKAAIVTTTEPQKSIPSLDNLQIVKEVLTQCQSPDTYWGAWGVRVNSNEYWVKRGKGEVVVEGPGEVILYRDPVSFALAADEIGWIITGGLISGGGSKIEKIYLRFLESTEWAYIDPSSAKYNWDSKFISHTVGEGDYPRHELEIQVVNNSDFAIKDLELFALIYDTSGSLVDAVSRRGPSIPYGGKTTLTAQSILPGNCIGRRDPSGYSADYWIDFRTIDENLVTRFFHIERTSEAELIGVQLSDPVDTTDGIKVEYLINNRDDQSHMVQLQVTAFADWTCPERSSGRGAPHKGFALVEVPGGEVVNGYLLANDLGLTNAYGHEEYVYYNYTYYKKENKCQITAVGVPKYEWNVLSENQEAAVRAIDLLEFPTGEYFDTSISRHVGIPVRISNSDPHSAHRVRLECRYELEEIPGLEFATSTDSLYQIKIEPNSVFSDGATFFVRGTVGIEGIVKVAGCEIISVDGISCRKGRQ